MGIAEITRDGVEKAIVEFDELGRDEFLKKYRFGKARDYFLILDGKWYDSKAIVGAAHGHSGVDREPLTPDEFSGGKSPSPVVPLLERLGFTVTTSPPPSPASPKADKEKVEKLIAALKQHAGQRLSASDLRRETGVAKHRIRKLLRESPLGVDVEISPKPPYRFWWGETVEEFPLRLFSWEVLSRRVAKKKLDRSAFLHRGTGVPAALTWFFGISERGPRFREVCLVFNGETFDARIPADNQGRYRLFWGKDFASVLGLAFPDSLSAHQRKLESSHDVWMRFKKVSAKRYEVEFSQEVSRQYFAFLANPNRYRIEDAIREREVDTWSTEAKNVRVGDRVIIWKAKGRGEERGIVAFGEVISGPEISSDADNPYWIEPPSEPKERVNVRYEVPEGAPLWLGGNHDEVLESLSVSRARGGTVFNVTPEQWSAVVAVTGGEKTPSWKKPEDDLESVRRRSQGRGLSPGKRKAIEEWAVERAIKRFPELDLQDVGLTKSWDLEDDTSGDSSMPIRIEVKGSTLQLDKITLTDNEVEHAKKARDEGICRLILVVVEKIELDAGDGEDKWIASGGEVRVFDPWGIDDGGLEPTQWRYRL